MPRTARRLPLILTAAAAGIVACGSGKTSSGLSPLPDSGSPTDASSDAESYDAMVSDARPNDDGAMVDGSGDGGTQAGAPTDAGFGATVYAGGVEFRVWAPFASQLWVRGDFNLWSDPGTALALTDDAGDYQVSIPGALAGQQYEYVIENAGVSYHRADPRSKAMIDDAGTFGNSVIEDPSSYSWQNAFTPPPFNEQVIYELHIKTFDGSPGVGTWASAMAKLGYLASLGVNMVEMMPIAEYPGVYSWGYNPSFPFAPESSNGTPDDLKRFIDAAHGVGIGVILDTVQNHYGPDLGRSLWQFDGETLDAGGIYFYTDWRENTDYGPRPDYGRPEVCDYIEDNADLWLSEFHADGLRWDSVVNIRQGEDGTTTAPIADGWSLLQSVNAEVHARSPGAIEIAEDLQEDALITAPVASSGAGFDSQWDPAFNSPVVAALTAGSDSDRSMASVGGALSFNYNDEMTQRLIYLESHDTAAPQNGGERLSVAICDTLGDDAGADAGSGCLAYAEKRTTLGAAVLLTTPGVPMLFQGEEFLEDLPFPYPQTYGIDWSKATTYAGLVQLYTDLIHLRENDAGTSKGLTGNNVNVFHVDDANKVIAYHRYDLGGAGDDVVIVANFSNTPISNYAIGFPRSGTWHVRFNGDDTSYSPLFGGSPSADVTTAAVALDGLGQSGEVTVGTYSTVIFSQ